MQCPSVFRSHPFIYFNHRGNVEEIKYSTAGRELDFVDAAGVFYTFFATCTHPTIPPLTAFQDRGDRGDGRSVCSTLFCHNIS